VSGSPWWTWLPLAFCLGGAVVLACTRASRKTDRLARDGLSDPAVLLYDTSQQAMLEAARRASLPGQGRRLADHLRLHCPRADDAVIAQVAITVAVIIRHHVGRQPTAANALDAVMSDFSAAAVELTSIDRTDVPHA